MKSVTSNLSGKCECGAVQLSLDVPPFLIYHCHCSHCRNFRGKHIDSPPLYHAGAAVWSWNVQVKGALEYKHTTSLGGLFAMNRGRCSNCKQPIYENCGRLVAPFSMVMTDVVSGLEPPNVSIFYNSGLQQGPLLDRTIRTDLGSLLYEIFIIIFVAIPMLPLSVFRRFCRNRIAKTSD